MQSSVPFEATFQVPSIVIAKASYLAAIRPCTEDFRVIQALQAIQEPFAWVHLIALANTTVVASTARIAQGSS